MTDLRKIIENTVKDCVTDLMCYDRKEDEELPIGEIERAIDTGIISAEDIVNIFKTELYSELDALGIKHD